MYSGDVLGCERDRAPVQVDRLGRLSREAVASANTHRLSKLSGARSKARSRAPCCSGSRRFSALTEAGAAVGAVRRQFQAALECRARFSLRRACATPSQHAMDQRVVRMRSPWPASGPRAPLELPLREQGAAQRPRQHRRVRERRPEFARLRLDLRETAPARRASAALQWASAAGPPPSPTVSDHGRAPADRSCARPAPGAGERVAANLALPRLEQDRPRRLRLAPAGDAAA